MIPAADRERIVSEQIEAHALFKKGMSVKGIADKMGLSKDQAWRRIQGARKRARLDPDLVQRLSNKGLTDLSGLHSGWLLEKDKTGSGSSLYFYLGPDEEKISFADAMIDALSEVPRLAPIDRPEKNPMGHNQANWLALADLHIGGDYGDPQLEKDFYAACDDLVSRLPAAEHAVLFELGDLMEANDHKGETPASGNRLEVVLGPKQAFRSAILGVKLIKWLLYRLLETHETVEAHFIKGNHDPTAHIAVLLALKEHFGNNPRIQLPVIEEEFRVVSWGQCAAFPHHGDTLKWPALKDAWAELFPDAWAAAKAHRHIMTAHFHHDRKIDLIGAVGEHFRTLHGPNDWAKSRGLLSRGSMTAMTVDKERGEVSRTITNIRRG
jgi:hypothetical protein